MPSRNKNPAWYRVPPEYQTPFRPDAWLGFTQPNDSYLTTYDLKEDLFAWSTRYMSSTKRAPGDAAIYRWCRRDWFGPLPKARTGRNSGYRIPPDYRYVARLWHVTEDPRVRAVGMKAILDDPKPWLVVVANVGSTHYTAAEAVRRVESLLYRAEESHLPLTVTYLGPMA